MNKKLLTILITLPLLCGLSGCSTFNVGDPGDSTRPTMDAQTKQEMNAAASKAAEKAGEAARAITDRAKNWTSGDTDRVVTNLKKLGKAVTDIKVTHTTHDGAKVTTVSYKLNGKVHKLHLQDNDFSLKNLIP